MSHLDFIKSVKADWPEAAQIATTSLFENQGKLPANTVAQLCDLLNCNVGELLPQLLPVAEALALANLSNFQVGCVAMGNQPNENGIPDLFLGTNIEYPNAPLTTAIHAEQCVSSIARFHGQQLTSLALNVPPCGICRQFLYEFSENQPLPIQIGTEITSLDKLLPNAFGPSDLIEDLSSEQINNLAATNEENEAELAKIAKVQAYAPYSKSPTSCIVNWNGQQAVGFSIENAAFNPSINAFSVAICIARMSDPNFNLSQIDSASIDTETVGYRYEAQLLLGFCNPRAILSRFP